jgi:hypothetical protein
MQMGRKKKWTDEELVIIKRERCREYYLKAKARLNAKKKEHRKTGGLQKELEQRRKRYAEDAIFREQIAANKSNYKINLQYKVFMTKIEQEGDL